MHEVQEVGEREVRVYQANVDQERAERESTAAIHR